MRKAAGSSRSRVGEIDRAGVVVVQRGKGCGYSKALQCGRSSGRDSGRGEVGYSEGGDVAVVCSVRAWMWWWW